MSKAGDINWEDLYKGQPDHPTDHRSKPLGKPLNEPTLKKGEVPKRPTDEEVRKAILHGAPRQPTDEELFGHLVPSEEQVKKAEDTYKNFHNNFYNKVKKPVEDQLSKDNENWGCRESIYKGMSEEEKKKRFAFANPREH